MKPQRTSNSAWSAFWGDVTTSGLAWVDRPALPLTTLAVVVPLELLTLAPEWISILATIPPFIFMAGFMGTQRLWFRRILEGNPFEPGEVWRSSWHYVGRFAWLAFVTSLAVVPVALLSIISPATFWAGAVVSWIAIDAAITFVSPALAYTTSSGSQAWRIGWPMARNEWKTLRWHVLTPPLVIVLVGRTLPALGVTRWVAIPLSIVGWMVNLLFKGAQAIPYLRAYPGRQGEPRRSHRSKRR